MRFLKYFLLFMLSLVVGCSAIKKRELMTPEIDVHSVYSESTVDDVQKAIIDACNNRGWKVVNKTDSQIDASLNVFNKHYVFVKIVYSTKEIKILYKDSINMLYTPKDKPKIHRSYNTWVSYLAEDIKKFLTIISNTHYKKK